MSSFEGIDRRDMKGGGVRERVHYSWHQEIEIAPGEAMYFGVWPFARPGSVVFLSYEVRLHDADQMNYLKVSLGDENLLAGKHQLAKPVMGKIAIRCSKEAPAPVKLLVVLDGLQSV